jgi:DNA-binding transcriptional ArsR family regulator
MIKSARQYEARATIAKALSHPTRLLLLDALANKELCVVDVGIPGQFTGRDSQ